MAAVADASTDPVLVFGHHHPWNPGDPDRNDDYFGINPDDSEFLCAVINAHEAIAGYFAGHTHRTRRRAFPEARNVPIVEIACVKDYPGAWAEYRVYEGGYVQLTRRIDDPALRSQGPRLAQNFVDLYLHQIFALGVFHGDPHPGNLFVTPEGRICFHDFGLIGLLDRTTRRRLAAFVSAFLRQDPDWLLDAAIDLGIIGGEIDRAAFRRGLAEIISDYAALPLKEWSLGEAFLRVTRLGRAHNVLIPYDLVVLMRAMFLAEPVTPAVVGGGALVMAGTVLVLMRPAARTRGARSAP